LPIASADGYKKGNALNHKLQLLPGIANALRLVRAGALNEAVAAIQRDLGPHAAAAQPTQPSRIDGATAKFHSHSFSNAAGSRDYKLYVPSAYEGRSLPLVVMLHGCTQSPEDFAAGTRMNELAEERGFFVAYPAQSPAANPNKCWNWFKRSEQRRDKGEPAIIAGIAHKVMADYALDNRQVYVAGLSSGGAMAATMAATYPDLFAAVGIHSGLAFGSAHDLPSGLAAMRNGSAGAAVPNVPAIVFHGDRDTLVHPRNGDELIAQWLADKPASGMSTESGPVINGLSYTRRLLHGASGVPVLEHWLIHGAGHAWSGGSAAGSHTDPRGPDASSEMVRFFLENPRYTADTDSVRAA
jgi:poly(hydroxyalkanoate) depolymerase family esterase